MTQKLILGTVQFGLDYGINNKTGKPDTNSISEILNLAFENNIRTLDSAEAYGQAHQEIGNYHRNSKNKFSVISKYNSNSTLRATSLKDRIYKNLEELGIESLYGYMFHSFNDFKTLYRNFHYEIEELKAARLIENFGVSVYTNQEVEQVIESNSVDFIQLPFNALDNNNFRGETILKAKENGIQIHSRSTFLQGLFFIEPQNLSHQFQALNPQILSLREIAKKEKTSMHELALLYCLQQNNIDKVLIGVDTRQQLFQNLNAVQKQLSKEAMLEIENIVANNDRIINPANWTK